MMFALISGCFAERIFQAAWLGNNACGGPPTSMVAFDHSKTATALSEFMFEEFSPPICGMDPILIEKGCCIQSLKLQESFNYSSMSLHYYHENLAAQAPSTANGVNYCHFKSDGSNSSLFGNEEMYYLASNECIDEFIKCSPNGRFRVYPDSGCQGLPNIYTLSLQQSKLNISTLGFLIGEFGFITDGETTFTWLQFIPSRFLVPTWLYPMEYVGLVSGIISLALGVAMIVIFGRIYYLKRRLVDLSFMIYYTLWLCDAILVVTYWTITYAYTYQLEILLQFQTTVFNISRCSF